MTREISPLQRFLAFFCSACPFCIAGRKWPHSAYARLLNRLEKNCIFCRAYAKVHFPKREEPSQEHPQGSEE